MKPDNTYYEKGSIKPTPVNAAILRALEKRQAFTEHDSLVIALVGLPGRGKSFISRKLVGFLNWSGVECKVFNVGKYRRETDADTNDTESTSAKETGRADFFDSKNEQAQKAREEFALLALHDMLNWIDGDEKDGSDGVFRSESFRRVGIFDATNSTRARRQLIMEECTSYEKRGDKMTRVVFVESICDDEELLEENFRFKVTNSPDFQGMSIEEAIEDLKRRVKNYEDQYETIDEQHLSYVKVFNLSSRIMANNIYGEMSLTLIPALMAWNISHRPIFLCRASHADHANETERLSFVHSSADTDILCKRRIFVSETFTGVSMRLDHYGTLFRDALCDFIQEEGHKFMKSKELQNERSQRMSIMRSMMYSSSDLNSSIVFSDDDDHEPFPLKICCSTLTRAMSTVKWGNLQYHVDINSNLNPVNKGSFRDMRFEEIAEKQPAWLQKFQRDPHHTRFPGGECYHDLVKRLEPCVMDMEQQVIPVLAVSHLSVIQVLLAYFLNIPVEECVSIEIPENTVIKLTPTSGGGWMESRHKLC